MFRGRLLFRGIQNAVAWLGLLLMIASFVWWQLLLRPAPPAAAEVTVPAPFTLVVLDPGHGGQDSGSMGSGVLEKDLTLEVAQRVDRLLQAQGLATLMTRLGDSYVSLADRAAVTNRARDCVFVSIHFNEGNKKLPGGVETYYAEHQIAPVASAISWLPFLQTAAPAAPMQAVNRGTKAGQFFVIANVRVPAVLVEGGFLTSKEEMAKLSNGDYREQMAEAISDGILRYREVLKQRQPTLAVTEPKAE
jgi:N-acetylmuramoyl-L-alanine amidase